MDIKLEMENIFQQAQKDLSKRSFTLFLCFAYGVFKGSATELNVKTLTKELESMIEFDAVKK